MKSFRGLLYPYQRDFYDKIISGEIDMRQVESRMHRAGTGKIPVRIIGVDLSSKPDMVAVAVGGTILDRATLNGKSASRKADREFIVNALVGLMERHGAKVERRDTPANPGYSGAGIDLHFTLNGVGAMVDIDNLHGGSYALISWHNTEYPARNFTSRFCVCIGLFGRVHPHHKATSCPNDWYSLAMFLDAGLMLAARGEAFEPVTA